MSLLATDVRVAITGEVSVAPVGTPAPTTATSSLNASFVGLGYVGEDGVTKTPKDTVQQIRAWQNGALVRTVRKDREWTLKFKLIESKGAVAKLYYAASTVNVVSANQYYVIPDTQIPDQRSFVLDIIDGSVHERIYIPVGEVTERGEVVYSNGEAIGREVTVTCFYNDTIGGPFKLFTDQDAWYYS
jgi:hypothetical protein